MVKNPTLKEIVACPTDPYGCKKLTIGEREYKESREDMTPKEILTCCKLIRKKCSKGFVRKNSHLFGAEVKKKKKWFK